MNQENEIHSEDKIDISREYNHSWKVVVCFFSLMGVIGAIYFLVTKFII